jgi:hypothetical protein
MAEPITRAPLVAYLVTSYALPGQLLRLVALLRGESPDAAVAVHHDARSPPLDRAALAQLDVHVVDPVAVEWGTFSQLAAVLRGIRLLLERSDFAWLVLLSGQDYPIRPLAQIEQDLFGADHDGHLERRAVAPPPLFGEHDEFQRRYFYRYRRLPAPLGRGVPLAALRRARPLVQLRTLPSGPLIGRRVLRSPFVGGLRCHHGADWFTLSRRCAERVDEVARRDRRLVRHYRGTVIPTESFVHTILHSDPELRLSGDTHRFTRWDDAAAPRPRVLRIADLPAILASGLDFARKFDVTDDAEVLDELDRRVHDVG